MNETTSTLHTIPEFERPSPEEIDPAVQAAVSESAPPNVEEVGTDVYTEVVTEASIKHALNLESLSDPQKKKLADLLARNMAIADELIDPQTKLSIKPDPTRPKQRLSLSDCAQVLALGAGVTASAVGLGAGIGFADPAIGAVAAIGFAISYLVKWAKTLHVDDGYLHLLDYMYAYARYINLIAKKHYLEHEYLQKQLFRVASIINKLRTSTFNKTPKQLTFYERNVTERMNRLATEGKLWITKDDVRHLETLISTSSQELQFIMTGINLYAEKKKLRIDDVQFDFKIDPRMVDLSPFNPKSETAAFKMTIVPGAEVPDTEKPVKFGRTSAFAQNFLFNTFANGGTRAKAKKQKEARLNKTLKRRKYKTHHRKQKKPLHNPLKCSPTNCTSSTCARSPRRS